jgi:Protein of unknown function (DUF2806)
MGEGNSVINLGDISKPATVLVEKICNAVGMIYEPCHIKRKAKAEVEAEKIKAISKIEISELEQRSLQRFIRQETRKQENIETITAQAAKQLSDDAKVEKLDEDWIAYFFKQCDTVSDNEMRCLWSKLLAGEASNPGTYSKRTVDFISTIDKKDAELFTKFCQFIWFIDEPAPLIYDLKDEVYLKQGINFSSLKHLDSIGLISFESISGYKREGYSKYANFFYYGHPTIIEFNADINNSIAIGKVLLTSIGKELVTVCGSSSNDEFYKYVINHWFKQGYILSSHVSP